MLNSKVEMTSLDMRDRPTLEGSNVVATLPHGTTVYFPDGYGDSWYLAIVEIDGQQQVGYVLHTNGSRSLNYP